MLQQAPFLEINEIEAAATSLLGRYGIAKRHVVNPPVPIDKLVNFLGLHLEIGDLYSLLEIFVGFRKGSFGTFMLRPSKSSPTKRLTPRSILGARDDTTLRFVMSLVTGNSTVT